MSHRYNYPEGQPDQSVQSNGIPQETKEASSGSKLLNRKMVLGVIFIALIFIVGALLSSNSQSAQSNTQTLQPGTSGSSGSAIRTLDGQSVSLSSIISSGKPTLLYFGATWCPHCQADLRRIAAIYPKYAGSVRFYWVDLDQTESPQTIQSFKNSYGPGVQNIQFGQANSQLLSELNIIYTTTRYVVYSDGSTQSGGSGELSSGQWDSFFQKLSSL